MKKKIGLAFALLFISFTAWASYQGLSAFFVGPFGPQYSWGDSLTAGALSTNGGYPAVLASYLGVPVANYGIGGQAAPQIAQRQGGLSFTLTISSNSLASGSNSVTAVNGVAPQGCNAGCTLPPNALPLSTPSDTTTRTMYGNLCGYHGGLTRTSSGDTSETYTFTPDSSVGLPITCGPAVTYTPDADGLWGYPQHIWAGKNGVSITGPSAVLADIALMVGVLTTSNYDIFSVTQSEGDYTGTLNQIDIASLNASLSSLYGARYVDVATALVNAYNPSSPMDVIDYQNHIPPASLRGSDGTGSLTSAISNTSTCSFSYTLSPGPAVNYQIITVDSETILIIAQSGGTVSSCTRGYNGTSAATHSGTATISAAIDPTHFNNAGYVLVAKTDLQKSAFLNSAASTLASAGAILLSLPQMIVPPQDTNLDSLGIGTSTLQSLTSTTTYYDTAVGANSLSGSAMTTAAIQNTAFGAGIMSFLTTGANNTIAGALTFKSATTGSKNTFIGATSAGSVTTGSTNVGIGYDVMPTCTSCTANTMLGDETGVGMSGSSSDNVAVGQAALYSISTGNFNTVLGQGACGQFSHGVTTGSSNVCIGRIVGTTVLTTGSSNILIGTTATGAGGADVVTASDSNKIVIGNLLFWSDVSVAAPAVTACGTSTIDTNANNATGQVNITAGAPSSCTITFAGATPYTTWNHCTVTQETANVTFAYSYSTSAITLTGTALAGKYDYSCQGY